LKLQSENQKLLSLLTTANEQIELLTSRAAVVNETELRNKELLRKAEEAKAMSDKALDESRRERQRAERALDEAARAEARQKKEALRRYEAECATRTAKEGESLTKNRYRALFTGIVIFTVTLAVLTAYSRRNVFGECGKWFADRMGNLLSFLSWLKSSFEGLSGFFSGSFPNLHIALCHAAAGVVFAMGIVGLYFAFRWIFSVIRIKTWAVKEEYADGEYKAILTGSAAISLFYVCLFLYEPIKRIVPLNIFSVWLLLSLIGAAAVNLKEIAGGFGYGR
jgi:hypothetical protein